ncbi:hypothetical protein M5689_000878 [Euphorbia peplus]|nr:hypothetical protein M5689_000878 [Euphorbia peplus]
MKSRNQARWRMRLMASKFPGTKLGPSIVGKNGECTIGEKASKGEFIVGEDEYGAEKLVRRKRRKIDFLIRRGATIEDSL